MAQKISYWLLLTLVISLGFGQLLRFDYLGIPIYLHDVIVLSILATRVPSLFQHYKVRNLVIPTSLKVFLAGLAIGWFYALFLFPISSLLIPSLYTLRLLAYIALHLLLKRSKLLIPNYYFLISGIIALFIGYLQYFLLPDMRIFQYLGWDDHLNRLTLPHFDPTFAAVMLCLSALYCYQQNRGRLAQLFLPAIFLTYSRSIWLTLFAVGLFYAIQTKRYAKLLLAVILLGLVVVIQPKQFGEGTNLLRLFSVESRVVHDLSYLKKYNWELLIGRGMNTLILDNQSSDVPTHATGPNNSYLYLLLTSGVLGLAGWGMLMYSIFQKSTHKPMLIFFFVASLFNNVMFYPFALLWVLLVDSQSKL